MSNTGIYSKKMINFVAIKKSKNKSMNKFTKLSLTAVIIIAAVGSVNAQTRLMNKLKDKAEDKMIDAIFGEDEKNENSQSSSPSNQAKNTSQSSSNNQNTKGGGLDTDIDVLALIDNASSQFNSSNYSGSRVSVRQAIQGIELEIGEEVLKSLPGSIDGLDAQTENDQVTSTGIGFVGLYIEREYVKNDMELEVVIANNSAWISAISMYMGSTAYATNGEEQYKQITFQGNQGIIEFNESSGYKLSVPFGQSSILVVQGINYDTEKQFVAACDNIKIDTIKAKMGEK